MVNLITNKLENALEIFNSEEMGCGYIYSLKQGNLVQLDIVDYSCCTICALQDIQNVELFENDEGILVTFIQGAIEGFTSCWIGASGVQF